MATVAQGERTEDGAATRGKKIAAYVPPELKRALKMRAAAEEKSTTDVLIEALRQYLGEAA